MVKQTVWECLLDSLHYYKEGNYQTFSFCFQRVFEYLQLDSTSAVVNKLKQRFYYTLNRLGYLEIDTSSPLNKWSVVPNHIVRLKGYYLAIAPPGFLQNGLSMSLLELHEFYIPADDKNIEPYCRVSLEKICDNDPHIRSSLKELDVPIVDRTSWKYLHNTTCINTISELFIQPVSHVPPSVLSDGQQFDFTRSKWLDVDGEPFNSPGMYRIPGRDNFSQIILRVDHSDGLKHYRVTNSEWAYLIAATLLGTNLGCSYKEKSREFYYRMGLVLPTIVERILVCHSFTNPLYRDGYFVYENIPLHTVKILTTEYPCLFEGNN